jgi:cation:H+ antiporter
LVILRFVLSAIAVVAGGIAAARFGDIIAIRTRLGELLFGTVLLAAGTSLPELIAGVDAVRLGVPDLAAGNMLGSILINILFLALFDLFTLRTRLLHRVAITQGLTAALAVLLTAATAFFILAPLRLQVLGVDLEGPILLATFIGGTRLIQLDARITRPVARVEEREPGISLRWAIVGFAGAVVLLVVAAQFLVASAEALAGMTGLAVGFIGVALFPLVTATPELVSTATAVRLGAYDLAVGNLFGSCVFNIFALALVSLVYAAGPFFSAIAPGFGLVAILGVILISLALLGTLARAELRVLGVEWDALLIIVIYAVGLYFLYRQGALGVLR